MPDNNSLENNDPRDELAALAKDLAENPATRAEMLRLTRKVRPDLPIPELDIDERISKSRAEDRKELDELRGQMAQRNALDALDKKRAGLRAKGLAESDEDIAAIEKLMVDKRIPDHETAADYWRYQREAAKPTPGPYNSNPLKAFDLKEYFKDPVRAARAEGQRAIAELNGPRRPIGLA